MKTLSSFFFFLFLFFSSLLVSSVYSADFGVDCFNSINKEGEVAFGGAGATFPQAAYAEWIFTYEISPAGQTSEQCYYSCGSSCGKSCILTGVDPSGSECPVTYGASDSFLSDSQYQQVPDIQMYPMLAGPVVPMYNLGSFPQRSVLILGREVLADIFMCEITNWRDPRIVELNSGPTQLCPGGNLTSPDCQLPDAEIKVYHRSDGSGTTETFTKALYSFSDKWKQEAGEPSATWPANISQKCKQGSSPGNYGTFSFVVSQDASISYVSFGIMKTSGVGRYAHLINKDNYTVSADSVFVQNAMLQTEWDDEKFRGDCIDVEGESWPISAYTYILFRKNQTVNNPSWYDCDSTREAIKYFSWALTDSTPRERAENLGYVPLAPKLSDSVIQRMSSEIFCDMRPAVITFILPFGLILPQLDPSSQLWEQIVHYSAQLLTTSTFSSSSVGLKGWTLDVSTRDSDSSQAEALVQTADLLEKGIKFMVGEFSDVLTNTIQILLAHESVCQLTPQTQLVRTVDSSENVSSSLIRVKPVNQEQGIAIFELLNQIGWDKIVVISTSESDSLSLGRFISETSPQYGITSHSYLLNSLDQSSFDTLSSIVDSGLRVIVSCVPNDQIQQVVEACDKLGLVQKGFTWIFAPTHLRLYAEEKEDQLILGNSTSLLEKLEGAIYFSLGSENGKFLYQQLLEDLKSQEEDNELVERVKKGEGLDEMSIYLYDLIFGVGWAIDYIIQPLSAYDIQTHDFKEMPQVLKDQVVYEGLTGRIAFNQLGDRVGEYVLRNLQKNRNTAEREEQIVWRSVGTYLNQHLEVDQDSFIFTGPSSWSSPPPDYVSPPDQVVSIDWDSSLPRMGLILTSLGVVLAIYFIFEVQHFESRRIIRAASLFFLRLVLVGIMIGFISNLLITLPPTKFTCTLYPWLSWLGFAFVFGGLYAKTWRVWRIFGNSKMTNLKMNDFTLFRTTLAIFSTNALILILWTAIDTPYVTETADYYEDGKTAEMCTSSNEIVWSVLFLIPFFSLVIGLSVISFMTRNIESKFNESRYLALAIYHFTVCFLLSVSLSIALRNFLEFQVGIRFIGIYVGLFGLMCILYVPKIWVCYFDPAGSNTLTTATGGPASTGSSKHSHHRTEKSSKVDSI